MKYILVACLFSIAIFVFFGCGRVEPLKFPPNTQQATSLATQTAVQPHTIIDAEIGQKNKCAVTGENVTIAKDTLASEYKGKVYYFCCAGCPEEFAKNPEKYANAPTPPPTTPTFSVNPHTITDAEIGLKTKCPVMGTEVTVAKDTLASEYKGKVYYFCCGGCPEEFAKNPEKYAQK